ncbi:hypothetical protein KGV55_01170, partial [Candidatus Gracilibacteria bacterium]|nr:hypothetical protein [Candidatus Gracilibacteria bacterium]
MKKILTFLLILIFNFQFLNFGVFAGDKNEILGVCSDNENILHISIDAVNQHNEKMFTDADNEIDANTGKPVLYDETKRTIKMNELLQAKVDENGNLVIKNFLPYIFKDLNISVKSKNGGDFEKIMQIDGITDFANITLPIKFKEKFPQYANIPNDELIFDFSGDDEMLDKIKKINVATSYVMNDASNGKEDNMYIPATAKDARHFIPLLVNFGYLYSSDDFAKAIREAPFEFTDKCQHNEDGSLPDELVVVDVNTKETKKCSEVPLDREELIERYRGKEKLRLGVIKRSSWAEGMGGGEYFNVKKYFFEWKDTLFWKYNPIEIRNYYSRMIPELFVHEYSHTIGFGHAGNMTYIGKTVKVSKDRYPNTKVAGTKIYPGMSGTVIYLYQDLLGNKRMPFNDFVYSDNNSTKLKRNPIIEKKTDENCNFKEPRNSEKTTKWLDEDGNELKSPKTGNIYFEKGVNPEGYFFVEEENSNNTKTYKYYKQKTTKWLDENDISVKDHFVKGRNFAEKSAEGKEPEGYNYVGEENPDNFTKIYRYKSDFKTTKWKLYWSGVPYIDLKKEVKKVDFQSRLDFEPYIDDGEEISEDGKTKTYKYIFPKTTKWYEYGQKGKFESLKGQEKNKFAKTIRIKKDVNDRDFVEVGDIPEGYEFVETIDGSDRAHWLRQTKKITRWVLENKENKAIPLDESIKDYVAGENFVEKGNTPDGYIFLKEEISDDGKTKFYIYKEGEQKITNWINLLDGNNIKKSYKGPIFKEQGETPDGYKFVDIEEVENVKNYRYLKITKTTRWIDENNKDIKVPISNQPNFKEKGETEGFVFVSEEINGSEKIYKFKKIKEISKTTKWEDEEGKELKNSETGKEFQAQGEIEGYIFKETKEEENVKTYIFKKKTDKKEPETNTGTTEPETNTGTT